jgi:putative inorganic carbon (hco3(-)) transporter
MITMSTKDTVHARVAADFTTIALISLAFLAFLGVTFAFGLSPYIPLFLFLGLAALALFVFKPHLFLGILVLVRMSLDYTSQFFTITALEHQFTLSEVFGISIGVIGFLTLVRNGRKCITYPLLPPFALLTIWGGLSLFYSISPSSTLRDLLRIFDLFTFGFLAYSTVRTRVDFKRLLEWLFLSFLIPLTVGFYQFAAGIGFQDESSPIPRIFGTFVHPNVFSLVLTVIFSLGILYRTAFAESKREQFFSSCFIALTTLSIILTLSRIAWVAAGIFLFFFAVASARKIILPLVLVPLIILALSGTIRERVIQTFDFNPDSSILARTNLWNDNIQKTFIDGRAWYGYGLESFPTASEELRGIRLGSNDAHNDYVKFFVEGGYVGLGIFLLYIALLFYPLLARYLHAADKEIKTVFFILFLVLVSIEISALTDNVFRNTPLWIIFFTAAGGAFGFSNPRPLKKIESDF